MTGKQNYITEVKKYQDKLIKKIIENIDIPTVTDDASLGKCNNEKFVVTGKTPCPNETILLGENNEKYQKE